MKTLARRMVTLEHRRILRPLLPGLVLLGALFLVGILAPFLAPHDPLEVQLEAALLPPGPPHYLGTDPDGADILSRILYGARLSLLVGLGTVSLSLSLGVLVGTVAGYFGRGLERLFLFIMEVLQSFPGLLLPLTLSAFFPRRDLWLTILALSAAGWVGYARVARAQVLSLRHAEFVTAAVVAGLPARRVLWRYLLPNMLSPLLVQATFGMANAILAEAGLSFLGLGAPPGSPSWGAMLETGRQYLLVAPHLAIFPGAAVMVSVLSLNLLGDALRDALDPRSLERS